MRATTRLWLCFFAVLGFAACGGGDPEGGDGGIDGGTDGGTDTDADTDQACSPEIFDTGTNAYWLQCLAGQCLVDDACEWEGDGGTDALTYDEAAAACPDGYGLPTIDQMMGLLGGCDDIDLLAPEPGTGFCQTCPLSTACNAIYPGVDALDWLSPEILHWSSTGVTDNDSRVWSANFQTGLIEAKGTAMSATAVCVRSE